MLRIRCSMDLRPLIASPAAFRRVLLIDADAGPRRLAAALDPWQAQDFEALDPSWQAVVRTHAPPAPTRAWIERPRGHSKTSDLAVMATWALFASRRPLAAVAAAADKDQARLLRDAIARLVAMNPWLGQALDVQAYTIVNRRTASKLEILSADAASSYGLLVDFVIADEVTHWPKRDLWDSLFSSAAKRSRCLLLTITNAGWQDSWQWPLREAVRTDDAWLFRRLDGCRASWISGAALGEQRRLLPPAAYQRLWLNVWASGAGDALDANDIDAALTLPAPPPPHPQPGFAYAGGLDLGLSRDHSAFVIVGRHVGHYTPAPAPTRTPTRREELADDLELHDPHADASGTNSIFAARTENDNDTDFLFHTGTNRIQLTDVRAWTPPGGGKTDLSAIEAAILTAHKTFGLQRINYDPWQAELLAQRLRSRGVPMAPVAATGDGLRRLARAVLEVFSERSVDLFAEADLVRDLRSCRVIEKSYGVRLDFPRNASGHGDRATAFALAVLAARGLSMATTGAIEGELIAY